MRSKRILKYLLGMFMVCYGAVGYAITASDKTVEIYPDDTLVLDLATLIVLPVGETLGLVTIIAPVPAGTIGKSGTVITYTPVTGSLASATINYSAINNLGITDEAVITVIISNSSKRPVIETDIIRNPIANNITQDLIVPTNVYAVSINPLYDSFEILSFTLINEGFDVKGFAFLNNTITYQPHKSPVVQLSESAGRTVSVNMRIRAHLKGESVAILSEADVLITVVLFPDSDFDGDLLPNIAEIGLNGGTPLPGQFNTEPDNYDSDGDGIWDGDETMVNIGYHIFSSPSSVDTDGDQMSDAFEVRYGLNPNYNGDTLDDIDAPMPDGLTNIDEFNYNTNPRLWDTDGDGVSDGAEVALGSNPTFNIAAFIPIMNLIIF